MTLNPLFLFVLFSLGYIFGLLLKNPTAGKFLIFGFVGIFIYEAVKDAGLLASAVFVAGIISHHVTPSTILDRLPRLSLQRRQRKADHADRREGRGQRRNEETTEDTHKRYEEYQKRNRAEDTTNDAEKEARGSKRKKPQPTGRAKPHEPPLTPAQTRRF